MVLVNKTQKIFIAGGRGMVGSAIKRKLKFFGYKNLLSPSKKEIDLTNYQKVLEWFDNNRPDIVVLAAAKVGGIYANNQYPSSFLLDNLKIQNNVIEIAFKNRVKRLLFLGSSCIYPKDSDQPIKEEQLLSGYLEKTNECYAIAKISGIKLCQALRKQYGFDAISLMPTNLYGTGDNYHKKNSHVLPALIRKCLEAKLGNLEKVIIWGTGKVKREFMYVDDCAEAILFLIENYSDSSPINIGTGEEIKISELASLIKKLVSFDGKFEFDPSKPDGTPRKLLNNHKILELGWKPKISLKEGILSTINSLSADFK